MTRAAGIDLVAIAHALREDDVDAAIELGLLDWDGDAACVGGAPVDEADLALLRRVRDERLTALAARERYRRRGARLQRLQEARRQRQAEAISSASANGSPALAGAAAAALARALAKAKR